MMAAARARYRCLPVTMVVDDKPMVRLTVRGQWLGIRRRHESTLVPARLHLQVQRQYDGSWFALVCECGGRHGRKNFRGKPGVGSGCRISCVAAGSTGRLNVNNPNEHENIRVLIADDDEQILQAYQEAFSDSEVTEEVQSARCARGRIIRPGNRRC